MTSKGKESEESRFIEKIYDRCEYYLDLTSEQQKELEAAQAQTVNGEVITLQDLNTKVKLWLKEK